MLGIIFGDYIVLTLGCGLYWKRENMILATPRFHVGTYTEQKNIVFSQFKHHLPTGILVWNFVIGIEKWENILLSKHRHVGCLSRGFGVARSVVKSVFDFEVPLRRKLPKTTQIVTLPGKGYFGRILGFSSLLGLQNQKRTSLHF